MELGSTPKTSKGQANIEAMSLHLAEYYNTIKACRFCWMCRHLCTVGNQIFLESVTPRGRALNLYSVLKGVKDYSAELADIIYKCCLCGLCKESCVGGYEMPDLVRAARADLVEKGLAPSGAMKIREGILKNENPWHRPRTERFEGLSGVNPTGVGMALAGIPIEGIATQTQGPRIQGQVLLFAGCSATYMRPSVLSAAIKVLNVAGVDFTMLQDEGCCGLPLYDQGFRKEAKEWAERNAESFAAAGCETIVTICPACNFAFEHLYPSLGVGLGSRVRVCHLSEFLLHFIRDGKLRFDFKPGGKDFRENAPEDGDRNLIVTYHDPCFLGRISGKYDPPREVIRSLPGVELREMRWNRSMAHCCGSSALHISYPEVGESIARRRVKEGQETGAKVLVSACPSCEHLLSEAAGEGLRVIDLIELVEWTLGIYEED